MRIAVLSCPVRARMDAAWLAVAGWSGVWSDAGRWRCPPLGRRCPDRVCTHRLGAHLELGCPADRTVERSAMSVARPATAGCPQEKLVDGDGVLAGVRRPHPGGSGQPAALQACPARHGRRSSRCPLAGPGLGARADERLRRGDLLPPPIGRRTIVGGGAGQWVSVSGSRPSALAGRGSARRRVVPSRRANRSARLAAGELASEFKGHIPLANQNSTPCPFTRPY